MSCDLPNSDPLILSIVLLVVFVFMIILLERRRNHREKAKERPVFTVDELIEKHGEPDDIIMVNPVEGNRSDSVILVYDKHGTMIVNGEEIPKKNILEVAFSNYANVYLPSDYVIQVFTNLPGNELVKTHMGNGSTPVFAKEVVQQIKNHL